MPLPPLPDNNTARTWFQYTTGDGIASQTHEIMFRFNQALAAPEDAGAALLAVLQSYGPGSFRVGWRVLAQRWSAAQSAFSVPVQPDPSLLAFVGTGSSAAYQARWEAVEDTLVGRSLTSGRKARLSLFRANGEADATFRFPMGAGLQTALSQGSGSGFILCIDGSAPSWYTYVNQNYNSYWEGEIRN